MRKAFGVVLTMFLVLPLVFAALTIISISTRVLDRHFYLDVFDNEILYEHNLSDEMMAKFMEKSFTQIKGLDTAVMSEVLRSLITREYLSSQVQRNINEVFDLLEGKTDTFDLAFDMTPIKQALQGPQQDALLHALVQALPICGEDQQVNPEEPGMYVCKPDSVEEDALIELMQPMVLLMLSGLPDEVPISENLDEELGNLQFAGLKLRPASLNIMVYALVALTLAIWLATALIGGVNWRERLLWLDWTLFIPALVVLISGIILRSDLSTVLINYGIDQALPPNIPLDEPLKSGIVDISRFAINRISNSFLMTSGEAAAASIILIAWGAIKRRARKEVSQAEDE
ncbi:MAG TPA: hypothetical protein G4N92_07250 [Anaerolineae bacterium]|nr:hypothetical protein [Anaerolineae bacterium]